MESIVRDILFVLLAFAIAFLNIAEAILILRCQSKKAFDKLLLSLALSDVLVGLAVAGFKLVDIATYNSVSWLTGDDFANIFVVSINFSTSNLLLITIDRFLAVRFPIKHRNLLTDQRVNAVIVLIWLLALAFGTYVCIVQFKWEEATQSLLIASGFLLLFGVGMMLAYIKIFFMISKRAATRAPRTTQGNTATTRSLVEVIKGPNVAERAVFITGGVVTLSFIICTYPFACDVLIRQSGKQIPLMPRVMLILNSLFNPFIYFFKKYLGPTRSRTAIDVMAVN